MLSSHWPLCVHCFTSLVSFTGFYTEHEPIFCLNLGVGRSVFLYGIWPNLFYYVSYRQSYQPFTTESQVVLAFSFIILEISASFSNSLKLSSVAAILDFTHTARGADETLEIWEPLDTGFELVCLVCWGLWNSSSVLVHNFSLLFSPLIRREIQNSSKIYQEACRKRLTEIILETITLWKIEKVTTTRGFSDWNLVLRGYSLTNTFSMDIDAICPLLSVWRAYSTFITKALIFILMVSKHEAVKCSWFYLKTRAL